MGVACVDIAGDGCTMVSGDADGTLIVWNLLNFDCATVKLRAPIMNMKLCPAFMIAAVGLSDGSIWILHLENMASTSQLYPRRRPPSATF